MFYNIFASQQQHTAPTDSPVPCETQSFRYTAVSSAERYTNELKN